MLAAWTARRPEERNVTGPCVKRDLLIQLGVGHKCYLKSSNIWREPARRGRLSVCWLTARTDATCSGLRTRLCFLRPVGSTSTGIRHGAIWVLEGLAAPVAPFMHERQGARAPRVMRQSRHEAR